MKTEIKQITPEIAKTMLKRNNGNRKINERHVRFLSNEMKKGNWLFDGQPIRLTAAGGLLDGQHRLSAIVESDTTQKILVISGIDQAAFKVMDTGKGRSAADVFGIYGIPNATDAAASCRLIINIQKNKYGKSNSHDSPSNSDVLAFYNQDSDKLKGFISNAKNLYNGFNKVITCSHIAAFTYLMAERSVTDSEEFWSKVCYGLSLEKGSPMKVLRDKLIADRLSKSKLPTSEIIALIFKAWNQFRIGNDNVRILRYNKHQENFPTLT